MVHQCTFLNFCTYLSDQALQSGLYVPSMYRRVVSSNKSHIKDMQAFSHFFSREFLILMYCDHLQKVDFLISNAS